MSEQRGDSRVRTAGTKLAARKRESCFARWRNDETHFACYAAVHHVGSRRFHRGWAWPQLLLERQLSSGRSVRADSGTDLSAHRLPNQRIASDCEQTGGPKPPTSGLWSVS